MGVLDIFRKKDDGVPDIGKEEELEENKEGSGEADIIDEDLEDEKKEDLDLEEGDEENFDLEDDSEEVGEDLNDDDIEDDEIPKKLKKRASRKKVSLRTQSSKNRGKKESVSKTAISEQKNLEIEKISLKLDSLGGVLKGHNEMFSQVNQQIGELRGMIVKGEKATSKLEEKSIRAIEIVKSVKPENIRSDYMKINVKVEELSERIEANKIAMESVLEEIKDLRRKAEVFIGTDSILKLNEEVKKDLVEIKKIDSRVRANATKSEGLFLEMQNGLKENEKLNELLNNLESAYSSMQKRVEKLKIDLGSIVSRTDLDKLKKGIANKFGEIRGKIGGIKVLEEENEGLSKVIENVIRLSRQNEEDLSKLALAVGDDEIEKVSDYEARFDLILSIMDEITGGMADLKKKVDSDEKNNKEISKKGGLKSQRERVLNSDFLGISEKKINTWNEKLSDHLENPIVKGEHDPWSLESEEDTRKVRKIEPLKQKSSGKVDFENISNRDFLKKIEEMRKEIKGLVKSREKVPREIKKPIKNNKIVKKKNKKTVKKIAKKKK